MFLGEVFASEFSSTLYGVNGGPTLPIAPPYGRLGRSDRLAWRPCWRTQHSIPTGQFGRNLNVTYRLLSLLLIVVVAGLSWPDALSAQTNTAVLTGRVLDSSGAPIQGAALTLVRKQTGQVRDAKSDYAGEFLFPLLPPGTYELS